MHIKHNVSLYLIDTDLSQQPKPSATAEEAQEATPTQASQKSKSTTNDYPCDDLQQHEHDRWF
jgi:hypothetical protein